MDREALIEEIAVVMHAEVCACGGTGRPPAYYQRAARAALKVIETAQSTTAHEQGNPNERR